MTMKNAGKSIVTWKFKLKQYIILYKVSNLIIIINNILKLLDPDLQRVKDRQSRVEIMHVSKPKP